MANPLAKNFEAPDRTREVPKGRLDLVDLDGATGTRVRYEPGFRWSECVGAPAGKDICAARHFGYVLAGRLRLRMADGTEAEVGPGDVFVVPPGHDGWVVGDEAFVAVDFSQDMRRYVEGA